MIGELRVWHQAEGAWQVEQIPGIEARDELFLSEARHLLDVVGGRAEPACTLDDGVQVARLCAAIEVVAALTELQPREDS